MVHYTDHKAITLDSSIKEQCRGRSFWRFSYSLIDYIEFSYKMKSLILSKREEMSKTEDVRVRYDILEIWNANPTNTSRCYNVIATLWQRCGNVAGGLYGGCRKAVWWLYLGCTWKFEMQTLQSNHVATTL